MRVPKILSSIVSGLSKEVKTDALTNNSYNLPLAKTDYYTGSTNITPKPVANPYGFEAACANFEDVKITKDLLYKHPQLVVNGDLPMGATCVYPDGEC